MAYENLYQILHKFPKIMESLPGIQIMLENISRSFPSKIEGETMECAPLGSSQRLYPLVGQPTCTADDHHRSGAPHDLPTSSLNSLEDGWSSPPLEAHYTHPHSKEEFKTKQRGG